MLICVAAESFGMAQEYEAVVDDMYGLPRGRDAITLDPVQDLMEELGHPERSFPAIHVGGTNGKGSTATMLARVLQGAGYTVGLYTSPHLVDVRERITVDGEPIGREELVDRYRAVRATDVDVSFFECVTAMALDHFAARGVDIAVVEVGMGGRLDATRVVDTELSVITNVSEEHTQWLGETEEEIAREIAGIIADDTPVVSGAAGAAADVVEAVAADRGAPVIPVADEARTVDDGSRRMTVRLDGDDIETDLIGRYQVDNINTVLAACSALDRPVPDAAVRRALADVTVPGRMEPAGEDPLVLLDGAHNPAAVERLPETLDAIGAGEVVALASVMAGKDYADMLAGIGSFADHVVLSEVESDRAAVAEDLADCVKAVDCEVVRSIPDALDAARTAAGEGGAVLVTGSLYFVGDVKKVLAGQE